VYDPNLQHIKTHDGKYCLEANDDGGAIGKNPCRIEEPKQKWTLLDEELPTPAPTQAPVVPVVTEAPSTSSIVTPAPTTSAMPATSTPMSVAATTPKPAVAQTTIPVTQSVTPKIEVPETQHEVHIRHQGQNKYCMDGGGQKIHMFKCNSRNNAQRWLAVTGDDGEITGQLRNGQALGEPGLCLANMPDQLKLKPCVPRAELGEDSPQNWKSDKYLGLLAPYGDQTRCLDATPGEQDAIVSLQACDKSSKKQQWDEETVDKTEGLPKVYIILLFIIAALVIFAILVAVLLCAQGKQRDVRVVDDGKKPAPVAVRPRLPEPKLGVFKFADPRPETYPPRNADIVAFSFPGLEEPWDELCSASFLANSYDVGSDCLQLKAKGDTKQFRNAEAAFQALTFWTEADEFTNLSGEQALQQKHARLGHEDWDYAGYENKWKGMMAVLHAKFKSGSKLEKALEKTGDAFLLNHSGRHEEDPVWSDNNDGEGTNWLGLQLMLLRDRRTGWKKWTRFIESSIDRQTGECIQPEDMNPNAWQDAVRNARAAVAEEMAKQGEEDRASEQPLLPADHVHGYGAGMQETGFPDEDNRIPFVMGEMPPAS